MQNKTPRIIRFLVTAFFALLLAFTGFYLTSLQSTASEGTISLSISKKKIKKDKEFTVCIKVHSDIDMHAAIATIHYDDSLIEWVGSDSDAIVGNSGKLTLSDTYTEALYQKTYQLTFKAKSLGQGTINVSDSSISTHKDLTTVKTDNASISYDIISNTGLDDDCSLEELIIGTGELTPAWDSNIYSYQVSVPKDTSVFAYSATPASDESQVVSTGPDTLQDGNNTYVITVTAPSGDQQSYTIIVNRN